MVNIRKYEFFDVITGEPVTSKNYGRDAEVYRRTDNVDLIFDSRGEYLGIRTCRGKIINGKFTGKIGKYDFKSFLDLKIWAGRECSKVDFIETKEGTFAQIRQPTYKI